MRVYLERGEGKGLIAKVDAIFHFEIIKSKGGPIVKSWTIDLKSGQGSVSNDKKGTADATF